MTPAPTPADSPAPQQLPPTVLSEEARRAGLGESLFQRLVAMGVRPHMLTVQYRMHPRISAFPNGRFYAGQIADAVREVLH